MYDSVFAGACTGAIVLSMIFLIKRGFLANVGVVIQSINFTLLISGVMGSIFVVVEFVSGFTLGGEAGYAFINRFFGPYWYAAWLMLIVWTILPQVLWLRRFRDSMFGLL